MGSVFVCDDLILSLCLGLPNAAGLPGRSHHCKTSSCFLFWRIGKPDQSLAPGGFDPGFWRIGKEGAVSYQFYLNISDEAHHVIERRTATDKLTSTAVANQLKS